MVGSDWAPSLSKQFNPSCNFLKALISVWPVKPYVGCDVHGQSTLCCDQCLEERNATDRKHGFGLSLIT